MPFQHVVVVIQENRTPDNLFQGLCGPNRGLCPFPYDISNVGVAEVNGQQTPVALKPVPLSTDYDLDHSHHSFVLMYDNGAMDGANLISAICPANSNDCVNKGKGQNLSYGFVDNSTGIVDPYLVLARQYGWANRMFQTNQGPSFPAHQFLFGGTSANTALDDVSGMFVTENLSQPTGANYLPNHDTGCLAPLGELFQVISPSTAPEEATLVNDPLGQLCFHHDSLATLLDAAGLSWKYYAARSTSNPFPENPSQTGYNQGGWMWNAPNAIADICQPDYSQDPPQCTGPEYAANDILNPSRVLTDISNCHLAAVSWVTPVGANSDHAGPLGGSGGPSWVAAIVNAVGNATTCDQGRGYWSDTAILITWDDWGGWYDHVKPPILPGNQGDYQYGFRVPLLVVSAYTPVGFVSEEQHDFGSILRFIEMVFHIREGALGFADARASSDLREFFFFFGARRTFKSIAAPLDANFFLHDPRPLTPPDDD